MNRQQWQERYDNPVRMDLAPATRSSWDHERLFVPELHAQRGAEVGPAYDEHMEHRQAQIRGSHGPDRERAELMERAERSGMQHYTSADLAKDLPRTSVGALEARQDLMERERSMARLVEHDRSHGHPMVHNPTRSPESATWDEKRQWAERDGRRLEHDERVTLGEHGAYDPFRRPQQLNPTPHELARQGVAQVPEQLAAFGAAVSPEPVSAVATLMAQVGERQEQKSPAPQPEQASPTRRSGLADLMEKRATGQQQTNSPEQSQSQEQGQPAARRSPLAELMKQRAVQRQSVPTPTHEQERGMSISY